jgi:hypothetical protein
LRYQVPVGEVDDIHLTPSQQGVAMLSSVLRSKRDALERAFFEITICDFKNISHWPGDQTV